jgi:hypothetical protein
MQNPYNLTQKEILEKSIEFANILKTYSFKRGIVTPNDTDKLVLKELQRFIGELILEKEYKITE